MTKNSNRKGLALGAIFALVASLFATAPAAQANEAGLVVEPIVGTSYTMVNTEDFVLTTRLGSQIQADRAGALKYIIAKSGTAGYGLSVSSTVSSTALSGAFPSVTGNTTTMSSVTTASTQSVVATLNATAAFDLKNQLRIQPWSLSALTTVSPALSVTVTAFLDLNGDNLVTGTEPSTTVTINFVSIANMGATVALTAPNQGDIRVTASAALATVNHQQLEGVFKLGFISTQQGMTGPADASSSATVSPATLAAGAFSFSAGISTATVSTNAVPSVSAVLYYSAMTITSNVGDFAVANTNRVVTQTLGVDRATATELTMAVDVSDHALANGNVRPNQTYTVRVGSRLNGASASANAVTVTFGAGSAGLVTGSKTVSINGGAELTNYPATLALTTGTDGVATFTIKTTGFIAGSDSVVLAAASGNARATLTLAATAPVFSITNDYAQYSTAPGTAANITYQVKDQWDVASARTDQRIMVTRGSAAGSTFNYAETVSYVAVVGGKATFAFTPAPATRTGSATVQARLQRLNSDSNVWVAEASTVDPANVAVNVTSVVATFSARSHISQSASISYFPNTVSFTTVTTTLTQAGVNVQVTGPAGLIFREGGTTATRSGSITLRADANGLATLNVASRLEGSHTITFTVGSESTTSLLVVGAAAGSAGVRVTFDKTSIVSGETSTVTGKVTDENGNPVDTTNGGSSALVVVSYTGKGLPFNTGSTIETDEKGEFKVNILALPGDVGTGTLTATYRPAGAAVDTRNVTATQVITIAAPAAVAAPEVNAVIGTFNGRWAVRVENAKGAVVSVKVGNRWVKYTSLNDNYLFSRKSRVGATLPVAVYVNGQLENVATITIK